MIYLQSRNRDTDIENKRLDAEQEGGGGGGMNRGFGLDEHTASMLCYHRRLRPHGLTQGALISAPG